MSPTLNSWIPALAGGALIGLASGGLMLLHGRIAGISGILHGAVESAGKTALESWRWSFLAGLLAAGLVARAAGVLPSLEQSAPGAMVAIGSGLLIGAGTRMGSGCTSGHGVCGLARLSLRSLAAVGAFLGTGIAVTALLRALGVQP